MDEVLMHSTNQYSQKHWAISFSIQVVADLEGLCHLKLVEAVEVP